MTLWKWLLIVFFIMAIGISFTYLALYALIGTVAFLAIKVFALNIKGDLQCK